MSRRYRAVVRILGALAVGLVLCMAILLAGALSTIGVYRVPATADRDPDLPTIPLAGYLFHGQTAGDPESPVIIVLHDGPGGDYRSLLPLLLLSDQYFLVFYDQRGSGLSPRVPPAQLNMEQYLEDLDAFVERFGTDRGVALIGHGFGASLAAAYIGRHGEKVNGAVLVEPGFLTASVGNRFMGSTSGMMPRRLKKNDAAWLIRSVFTALHVNGPDGHERRDWFNARVEAMDSFENPRAPLFCGRRMDSAWMPRWRVGAMASDVLTSSMYTEDGPIPPADLKRLARWDGEVLFLAGACNTVTGADLQRQHMKLFAGPALRIIPNAGHTLIGEQTELTLSAIREYLQREPRSLHFF